ncbi:unnamed protein product, partial [marine sediment metagenome]
MEKGKQLALVIGLVVVGFAIMYFVTKAKAEPAPPDDVIVGDCDIEGETKCFGTNLCTCIAKRWRLTEASSLACGYIPPAPDPGVYYNPWGAVRCETYYCRHIPGHADVCGPVGLPA